MPDNKDPSVVFETRNSYWYKRTWLEKRLLILFVIAVVAAIGFLIAIIAIVSSQDSRGEKICVTEKCILSASNLLTSMDTSKDPCEDFYDYACGNWKKSHPIPDNTNSYSWIQEKQYMVYRNVRDFLRKNHSDEPSAWSKAKTLYKSCMDTETLDALKLKPVFEIMKMIGLQEMPPLPGLSTPAAENKPKINWLAVAAKAKKFLSIDLLIGFDLSPFFNSISNIILTPVRQKSFLSEVFNSEEKMEDILVSMVDGSLENNRTNGGIKKISNVFLDYRRNILASVYNKSEDEVMEAARIIFLLEVTLIKKVNTSSYVQLDDFKKLPQIINGTQDLRTISDEQLAHISINTLQTLTDNWSNGTFLANWTEYFSILYEDVNGINISGNDTVFILNPSYMEFVIYMMSVTPRETVEMLMWWNVMEAVASYTTTELRQITEKYVKSSSGVEAISSRSITCTTAVIHTMSLAVMSFTANSEFLKSTKKAIDDMYMNIKDELTSIIKSSTWLDSETKMFILMKLEKIFIKTGYPEWLLDKDKVEEYYERVEIHEGQFLLDAANISRWKMEKKLASLITGLLTDEYYVNPTDVNAYYNPSHQSITFLAGYLQFPFYDLGHDALNYGLTAFTMGHELHHAFDTNGIQFKNGKLGVWLSMGQIQDYLDRRNCFIQQYNKYGWDYRKVDGEKSVDENMPDHGGLRTSLMAYKKILKNKGSELQLPGLTNYTSEQLFFLSFANFFCMEMTELGKVLSLNRKHSPQKFRLIGSVTNSEEFSRIWKCPKGTKMNPDEEKCKLW